MKSLFGIGLVLLTLLLGGCAAKVQSFAFTLPNRHTLTLSEKPRLPKERRDLFAPGSGKGPVYTLGSAYTVSAKGQGFYLRYRGNYPGAAVMVLDAHGDPLRRAALPMQPGFSSLTVHVPLADGTVIGGFQLISTSGVSAADSSEAAATGLRIIGAGIDDVGPAFRSEQGIGVATETGGGGASAALSVELQSGVRLSRDGKRIGLEFDQTALERTGVALDRVALVLRYRYTQADGSGPGYGRAEVRLTAGNGQRQKSYLLMLRPGEHEEFFYASVLGFAPASVTVQPESAGLAILRAELLAGPAPGSANAAVTAGTEMSVPSPVPADIGTILHYPQKLWRQPDFELFAWNLFPQVLIMDTRSYAVQAAFFRRLSFFEEKRGYRGTVLSDRELDGMHGWNGHNYNGDGLAPFFNDARKRDIRLTPQEELLRRIALAYGLIKQGVDGYLPGEGGILSVSEESAKTDGLLSHLLIHESLHGAYYMTPKYRDAVHAYWNGMTDDERSFWKLLFGYLSYDPTFSYLVVNEFQAYLLQQPLSDVSWYFRTLQVSRLEAAYPARKAEIEQFLARYPDTFRRAASAVGAALTRYTGLLPGDTRDLLPADTGK